MTYTNIHARSGFTAIAAVLALSSTSLLAQEVTPPADPVTQSSPDPAPASDPLAAEPAASQPTVSEPADSQSQPAAAKPPVKAQSARTTPRSAAAANRAQSTPARSVAPGSEPAAAEPPAEPTAAAPLPATSITAPAPLPAAEPVPDSYALTTDEVLPIAGAAGLGLLVLAGAGLAARRRRRRDELEHFRANEAYLAEHPVEPGPAASEPAFARSSPSAYAAAPAAAMRTDAPRTKLPEGFDLSRFGPHTRAAYLGPTPDNPSLSLKYRLRKAAALDQRARLDAETRPEPRQTTVRAEPSKQPSWAANGDGFMLRRPATSKPVRTVAQN